MAEERPQSPSKMLAARLVGLGAIPIAVFCAVAVLMRAFVGMATPQAQGWVITEALAAAMASLFVLASLASRTVVGEVEAVREAVRNVKAGAGQPEFPELTPEIERFLQQLHCRVTVTLG